MRKLSKLWNILRKYGLKDTFCYIMEYILIKFRIYDLVYLVKSKFLKTIGSRKIVKNIKISVDKRKLYFKMILDKLDKGLSRELILSSIREASFTRFFINNIHKNDIVLDIGSNKGYFAFIAALIANHVIAVEPVKENFYDLICGVNINDFRNIDVYKLAIGGENKNIKVVIPRNHYNWAKVSEISSEDCEDVLLEEVEMRNFESFWENIKSKPTVLRMDVEGFEYQILMSALRILEKENVRIFMEFHANELGPTKSVELLKALHSIGYRKVKAIINFVNEYTLLGRLIERRIRKYGNVSELESCEDIPCVIKYILTNANRLFAFHLYLEK